MLLPLRAFLGVTFLYAGFQKLADRWFFKASAPSSLPTQLRGAAHTSPIGSLIGGLSHHAVLLGLLIAFGELAVGLGTLLGLWARAAATAGLLLSLGFLLTVSWHSRPYYYGADIVFVFAWTPLILGGAGRLSLDAVTAANARANLDLPATAPVTIEFRAVQELCGSYDRGRCTAQRGRPCGPARCPVLAPAESGSVRRQIDRRTFIGRASLAGWVGASALSAGGVTAALGRLVNPRSRGIAPTSLNASPAPSTSLPGSSPTATGTNPAAAGGSAPAAAPTTTPPTTTPPTTTPPTTTPPTVPASGAGTRIGPASAVPVGSAASFTDPATGDPAYVLRPTEGRFIAFDATCTHQGCPVQYAGSTFRCPCHGAVFDATTGAVIQGPARRPLGTISIHEGSDGQLYVL